MPKLNRNQLKGLVKECLLEILSEGLLAETTTKPKRRTHVKPQMEAVSDDRLNAAINESVQGLTDNPVMAEIFADTARTTLQEQLGAEKGGPMMSAGDTATRQMAKSDPDEVFGEAASRWASLAFAEKAPGTE